MLVLLVMAVTACGNNEGSNVASPLDVDAITDKDHVVFPGDQAPDTDLDSTSQSDLDGLYFDLDEDSFLDLPLPPEDGQSDQDGGGDPMACSKDSDCLIAPLELAPCQRGICDKHLGMCIPGPKSSGESCDDDDLCTILTVCNNLGLCVGTPVICDDGKICTTDTCQSDLGCVFLANDNVCDDGNGCTNDDRCDAGTCAGIDTTACACSDDDDCSSYDDGNNCNGLVSCVFGTCKVPQSSVKVCKNEGANPCARNICQPDSGECLIMVSDNGRPCDDGDACTAGDLCLQGLCTGSAPRSCDDDNPCTMDTCIPETGCLNEHSLYPCDDKDACTVNDHCRFGTCIPGASNICDSNTCFPKWSLMCGALDYWSTGKDGSTDNVKHYSCLDGPMPGPEYTYAFVAPFDGTATVSVTTAVTTTRLFLLEGKGTGCDSTNCRAASEGVLTFDMFAGQSYFLVVDSSDVDSVEYAIAMECQPHHEQLCDDQVDDDDDGLVDCEDLDCLNTPDCPAAKCMSIWTLSCGAHEFGANYELGSGSAITAYYSLSDNKGCLDNQWEYPGPEFAYRFDAPGDFNVTVRLLNESAQTDLLILRDNGQGCEPADCIAWGLKKVTFPAQTGKTYYFVVDGYGGAQGEFEIQVECPAFIETHCYDGIDNDLDTLTDCEDDDCYGAVECIGFCKPARQIDCGHSEAFANFGWGSTDAINEYTCSQWEYSGPEMAYRFKAPYDTEVEVKLQLENASTDLLVVEGPACDPANCIAQGLDIVTFDASSGTDYYVIIDGYQGALGTYKMSLSCVPDSEMVCDDGTDNDGDGLTDCSDEADCSVSSLCPKCQALYPLSCGDSDEWTTSSDETTDVLSSYSCTPGKYEGPEFAYTFEPEESGPVTLQLTSTEWDLDVLVLQGNGYGCNPAACIAWGTNIAHFEAAKGVKYYIVVDGYGQAPPGLGPNYGIGDYVLSVSCD